MNPLLLLLLGLGGFMFSGPIGSSTVTTTAGATKKPDDEFDPDAMAEDAVQDTSDGMEPNEGSDELDDVGGGVSGHESELGQSDDGVQDDARAPDDTGPVDGTEQGSQEGEVPFAEGGIDAIDEGGDKADGEENSGSDMGPTVDEGANDPEPENVVSTGQPEIGATGQFFLVDAQSDEIISELTNGIELDASMRGAPFLTIMYVPDAAIQAGSVVLNFGGSVVQTESVAPFVLFADVDGDILAGDGPLFGDAVSYDVSAIVYQGMGGAGQELHRHSISFEVTASDSASDVPGDGSHDAMVDHGEHNDGTQDDDDASDGSGMGAGVDHSDHGGGHSDGVDPAGNDSDGNTAGMDHGEHNDGMQDDDSAGVGSGMSADIDHGDHGHGGHAGTPSVAPPGPDASFSEISAYVASVKASSEPMHVHGSGAKHMEHMAVLDLVDRSEASHVAVRDGAWDDASTWYEGRIPGDDARVLIPEGIAVSYGTMSDAELFTVRVDGVLDFDTDVDSRMMFDTMVVSPTGSLIVGSVNDPVDADVNIDLVVANNGPIDTSWDEMLLSRGLVSMGEVSIHGAAKDSHEKVTEDPLQGDTSIKFDEVPVGWEVGDTIVIAGTHYDGYKWDNSIGDKRHYPPEDEERIITEILNDGTVVFDEPLEFDHVSPRDDLKTSVANYNRNVSIETERGAEAEVFERGHVMLMHSDYVDVRFAEFRELGRTDKSEASVDISDVNNVRFDTNVQGRYSLHLHRTGVDPSQEPTQIIGNAVYGSPGWGYVHHDSSADLINNASYDTFGAGFVAETGNETGIWAENIAIFAQGASWADPKNLTDLGAFDTARGGHGFWFQGRLVTATDNVAASVNTGFVYFHRNGDDRMIDFEADLFEMPEALYFNEVVRADDVPILHFDGNETFAAKEGLHVVKANPNQGHDVWSHLADFTAWSVQDGAHIEYTSHYILENFDVIGKEETQFSKALTGIDLGGNNVTEVVIINPVVEGFETGIRLHKDFTANAGDNLSPDLHDYFVINPTFHDVGREYSEYNPNLDTILEWSDIDPQTVDLDLSEPLRYTGSTVWTDRVQIDGTKTDSLGTTDFPGGTDNFDLRPDDVLDVLEAKGYWTTEDGDAYTLLNIFLTDRASGDVYYETHPLNINNNVNLDSPRYNDVNFNGTQDIVTENGWATAGGNLLDFAINLDLNQSVKSVNDDVELWETLTSGQGVHNEDLGNHWDNDDDLDDVA